MGRRLSCPVLVGMLLGIAGCGGSNSSRMELQGKVSYRGQPVAAGQIYFKSLGEKSVHAGGIIKDGVFQTSPDYGPAPGRQEVRIIISDGRVSGDDGAFFPQGKATTPDQLFEIDLLPGTKVVDFELPVKK